MNPRRPSAPLIPLALGVTLVLAMPQDARAQQGETRLLFHSRETIPFAELLDLLDLLPGIDTKVTVASSATGPRGTSVTFADGHLGCHVEGDDLILEAFAGPGAAGTCYARACTTTLGLLTLCSETSFPMRSVACMANADAVDAGCTAAAPACDESAEPSCVGCTEDTHCGAPDLVTLVAGQTVTVADDLLRRLLGVDLTAALTDVQVRADASAPWSDTAVAGADLACRVGPDNRVQVAAGADAEANGTCQVRACVALLGLCLETELDLLVDACVLSGTCDPVAVCDTTTNTCLSCRDDRAPGLIDSGCATALPACSDATCVQCTADADCRASLLPLALAPGQGLTVGLADILEVLQLTPTLLPSAVSVGAHVNGPFGDEALLGADAQLARCAVDADGDVEVLSVGAEGHVTCYVEVCADLIGAVSTCLVAPIDLDIDACVLSGTCNLEPVCLDDHTCAECRDSEAPGRVDRGCGDATPACDGGRCVECVEDLDCAPRHPLVDLDLGDTGLVPREDILAALDLDVNALVDELSVAATADGPFADTALLDVDADVARCSIDVDGDVLLLATAEVYGEVTCYVQACVNVLTVDTCLVVPVTLNVDPCASAGTCRPPVCGAEQTCEVCRDAGPDVIDPGCATTTPACLADADESRCVECTVDADCTGNLACDTTTNTCVECLDDTQCPGRACDLSTNTCVICRDDTVGGLDTGCDDPLHACLELEAEGDHCVECTVDTDCDGNLVCDTSSNTCVECLDDARCPDGACDLATHTCEQRNRVPNAIDDLTTTPEDTAVLIAVTANDLDADGDTLTLEAIETAPARGTAERVGQHVRYTPAPDQHGVEAFTYRVCDPDGACDTALVEVTVTPVNDAPRAFDDDVETTTEIDVDVLANDLDPDGDPLTLGALAFTSGQGTFVALDGQVRYTPPAAWTGTATARYEACDPSNACESAIVTVRVGATSPPLPVVLDDEATTPEGVAVTVDVLTNDTAPEGTTLTVSAWTQGDHGSVSHANGALTYAPGAGFVGADSFGYVACTADGRCAQGRVTVEVTPGAPQPPAARDDAYTLLRDTELDFDPTLNDSDPDGDDLVVADFTQPAHGTVTRVDTATLTYAPAPGFVGQDLMEVTVADADGLTAVALVTFQVLERDNTSPIARDDEASAEPGVEVAIDVLANDEDPDGDPLTITTVVLPEHVSARFDPATVGGPIFVTLDADFIGESALGYRVSDGRGGFATARVTVRTPTPNAGPDVVDDAASTPEDTTISIDVLDNDDDPDGDELTVTLTTPPRHGAAVVAEGRVTYTPAPDYHGADSFTYRACDPDDACGKATVSLTVTPVADAPRAEDDHATVGAGSSTTLDVLANDLDPDGDPLAVDLVTTPATGTLRLVDGALVYDAPVGFEGEVTATYEACDPGGLCDSATLTVTVTRAPIGGPVPTDDEAWTDRDTELMVDVLANDTHPEGATLVVRSLVRPERGEAWPERGMVGYRPPEGWLGDDVLWYEVCDPALRCAMGMITVHVVEPTPNAAPVATDDAVALAPGESVAVEVLANDHDPDGDGLTLVSIGTSRLATLTVTGDNRVLVLADGPELGEESIDYIICDGRGACTSAAVHISVRVPGETPSYIVTGGPSCQGGGGGASLLGIALLIVLARARRRTI